MRIPVVVSHGTWPALGAHADSSSVGMVRLEFESKERSYADSSVSMMSKEFKG